MHMPQWRWLAAKKKNEDNKTKQKNKKKPFIFPPLMISIRVSHTYKWNSILGVKCKHMVLAVDILLSFFLSFFLSLSISITKEWSLSMLYFAHKEKICLTISYVVHANKQTISERCVCECGKATRERECTSTICDLHCVSDGTRRLVIYYEQFQVGELMTFPISRSPALRLSFFPFPAPTMSLVYQLPM